MLVTLRIGDLSAEEKLTHRRDLVRAVRAGTGEDKNKNPEVVLGSFLSASSSL
jgi:hypothetical protein